MVLKVLKAPTKRRENDTFFVSEASLLQNECTPQLFWALCTVSLRADLNSIFCAKLFIIWKAKSSSQSKRFFTRRLLITFTLKTMLAKNVHVSEKLGLAK